MEVFICSTADGLELFVVLLTWGVVVGVFQISKTLQPSENNIYLYIYYFQSSSEITYPFKHHLAFSKRVHYLKEKKSWYIWSDFPLLVQGDRGNPNESKTLLH